VTHDEARLLCQERLGVSATGDGAALVLTVPVDRWVEAGRFVKDTLGCAYMNFSTAVDWKDKGLEVVARVENLDDNFSVTMKTMITAGEPRCPSLVGVWRGANWMEREGYDMFGIQYEGHPDLRRILLPQDWEGHPLLKSYAVDTPHPPYR